MNTETIVDILNSPEFNEMFDFETEKKELEASGWSYQDIQEMAKFVIKNNTDET